MTAATIDELRTIPVFRQLPDFDLKELAAIIEKKSVRKDRHILKAKDPGGYVMFVLSGRVRVTMTDPDGRELILNYIGQGESFGELALLTGKPRAADVEAAEDCAVLMIDQTRFGQLLEKSRGLALSMLKEMAERLRNTSERLHDIALLDVYRRIPRVLLSLAEDETTASGSIKVVKRRLTHRELAALTGTTRERVTRILKELEQAGHIEMEGKRLIVKSLPV